MTRSASASSSAANASSRSPCGAPASRSRARYGAGAAPWKRASTTARPRATAASQPAPRSISARSTLVSPSTTLAAQRSDSARKSARLEQRVGDAEGVRLAGLEHPVVAQRVLDDDLHRALGADEVRQQVRAAPAGHASRGRPRGTRGPPRRWTGCGTCSAARARGRRPSRPRSRTRTRARPARRTGRARRGRALRASRACSRVVTYGRPVRSAPTAKTNGLPVTAAATISPESASARTSSSASPSARSPPGPKVFGLRWSRPLSSVISAARPASNGRSSRRTFAAVTISVVGAGALMRRCPRARWCRPGSPRSRCPPCPARCTSW